MKKDDSKLASRVDTNRVNQRRAFIVKCVGGVVFVTVAVVIGLIVLGATDNSNSDATSTSTGTSKSKTSSSTSGFYDIGKASSSSSKKHDAQSSSTSSSASDTSKVSSSDVSSSSAVSSQASPAPQPSTDTTQQGGDTSSVAPRPSDDYVPVDSNLYATLQPTGGQALYSWAISQGTTADAIYRLNPGITASNWSNYVGQTVRIR